MAECRWCKRAIGKDVYGQWRDNSRFGTTNFLSETCNLAPMPLGRQVHEPAVNPEKDTILVTVAPSEST